MKKIFALLLAVIMVMSLATVASAATDASKTLTLNKIYTVTGQKDATGADVTDNSLLPKDETLVFTSTLTSVPDVVELDDVKDSLNLTIASLATSAITEGKGTMAITLPTYTVAGIYEYEIAESVATQVQGATYSQEKIGAKVYVTYDANNDLVYELVLTDPTTGDDLGYGYVNGQTTNWKIDTFENAYKVGHLDVKKTVSGNLADQDVEFKMTVTFAATKPVKTDITVVDGSTVDDPATAEVKENITVIEGDGWFSKEVVINVKHNETVNFYNIPDGVTYTVVEDAAHKLADGETVADPNSAKTEDYKAEGEVTTPYAIVADTTDTVTITNSKETSVETGVVMDSVPFVVMAVVAVLGLALVSKKRVQE